MSDAFNYVAALVSVQPGQQQPEKSTRCGHIGPDKKIRWTVHE
ncbi:MAG: hypothetical protein WCE51_08165 [Chthoniobacterales bacterium]